MNIKRAMAEIMDTIEAYLLKDGDGDYVIPIIHQRPIFLIGPPGIGKTQIMGQIAQKMKLALVSYTITHHTRQSAIGLPFISEETFDGKKYSVTEYTMSEIVASMYQKMEQTGLREGILFIDEINCVSETLAPAMLQFLQCKTFGNLQIPRGWIIVAAGNPPEYNRSVREFDVVTMDRVKRMDVEPDFDAWKEYAYQANVHPAVLAYLQAKPQYFCRMETTVDGRFFATPRGWEDLSRLLWVYESLKKGVDRDTVTSYIQYPAIARDFANYWELFHKYEADYAMDEVFAGHIPDILIKKIAHASFDERYGVLGLILARCRQSFLAYCREEEYMTALHETLSKAKTLLLSSEGTDPALVLDDLVLRISAQRETETKAELLTREEKHVSIRVESFLSGIRKELADAETAQETFERISGEFGRERQNYEKSHAQAARTLEYAFDCLEVLFGQGQEIVLFLTELNANPYSVRFLKRYACERYDRYNQELLYEDRSRAILKKIEEADSVFGSPTAEAAKSSSGNIE
ncbi:MAG: AAA family ATPase [Blautia sp.]|nr:AAA family ATPase [Blautia sp.]